MAKPKDWICCRCDAAYKRDNSYNTKVAEKWGGNTCTPCSRELRREQRYAEAKQRTHKACSKCGEVKASNTDNFQPNRKMCDGLDSWCRSCRNTNAANHRGWSYSKMISMPELKNLLNEVDACEICQSKEDLVVDHCHKEEQVRGILCTMCNKAIGKYKDSPDILRRAYEFFSEF